MIQQTPLAELHHELGAKMIPFAGWNMPVQYSSIMNEHAAVREAVGVFDISHMGQFFLSGEGAEEWLNSMLTNDVRKLAIGEAQYTLMLNKNGGVIDDLIIYRLAEDRIFMVVNASMIAEDYSWLTKHLPEGLTLIDESLTWAGMAVQGPESAAIYAKIFPGRELPPRNGVDDWEEGEQRFLVCRTGYTGEDGFELFCKSSVGSVWFSKFIEAGAKPCGLGARDTLRLEVCYPLNGSDLAPERSPLQAGLGFFCALDTDFIGVEALRKQKEEGLAERLVALKYTGKGAPPRAHYGVFAKTGEQIGELSSGVLSPSLREGIAMAYLPQIFTSVGALVEIDVRGRRFEAKVVKKPFYKKG
ncbi:glycine cleavage system aminomethyltransferase GcvT [Rubritalea sp.]|uniref:glycine cleavage system aminomethyltransferase GcvT n=1 Tax=Rubritalea sp. TaxID=2109375 RepID=UPI003EF2055E